MHYVSIHGPVHLELGVVICKQQSYKSGLFKSIKTIYLHTSKALTAGKPLAPVTREDYGKSQSEGWSMDAAFSSLRSGPGEVMFFFNSV